LQAAFAGIDVAIAMGKKLPICISVIKNNRLTPLTLKASCFPVPPVGCGNAAMIDGSRVSDFVNEALEYLRTVERIAGVRLQAIAIDGPRVPARLGRRACEAALDKMGIHCYPTPTEQQCMDMRTHARLHLEAGRPLNRVPHGFQLWMLASFEFFSKLSCYWDCLEVYPQATIRVLGGGLDHKTSAKGLAAQVELISRFTGWTSQQLKRELAASVFGANHDRLDAYMCSWIASLYPDRVLACGFPPGDVIWVPDPEKLDIQLGSN
jgi:hypothetical protein